MVHIFTTLTLCNGIPCSCNFGQPFHPRKSRLELCLGNISHYNSLFHHTGVEMGNEELHWYQLLPFSVYHLEMRPNFWFQTFQEANSAWWETYSRDNQIQPTVLWPEWAMGHKVRRDASKLIFLIYGSIKLNIKVSGWLYQSKIHMAHFVYQENYQSIPFWLWFR